MILRKWRSVITTTTDYSIFMLDCKIKIDVLEGEFMKGKVYQAILCLCLNLEKMIERVEGR